MSNLGVCLCVFYFSHPTPPYTSLHSLSLFVTLSALYYPIWASLFVVPSFLSIDGKIVSSFFSLFLCCVYFFLSSVNPNICYPCVYYTKNTSKYCMKKKDFYWLCGEKKGQMQPISIKIDGKLSNHKKIHVWNSTHTHARTNTQSIVEMEKKHLKHAVRAFSSYSIYSSTLAIPTHFHLLLIFIIIIIIIFLFDVCVFFFKYCFLLCRCENKKLEQQKMQEKRIWPEKLSLWVYVWCDQGRERDRGRLSGPSNRHTDL